MSWQGWMKNNVPDVHIQLNGATGKWDAVIKYCPDSLAAEDWKEFKISFKQYPDAEQIKMAIGLMVNQR